MSVQSFGRPIEKVGSVPAYVQVKERIIGLITEGAFVQGAKLPSEPEIAALLGVSRMTANKSILALVSEGWLEREKGRGTFVSKVTSAPVGVSFAVAINEDPVNALEDYYFGGLYWGLRSALSEQDIPLDVIRYSDSLPEQARMRGVHGLIAINPPRSALSMLEGFADQSGPVVLLGASWSEFPKCCVDSDNVLGSLIAVNHLLDLGHRRTMFVGACPDDSNTIDRVRGYHLALKGRGLSAVPSDVFLLKTSLGFDAESEQALSKVLRSSDRPSAIFAGGSRQAMQVLGLASKLGLSVPSDLSIVGYDDPGFLSLAYPPVTTIRQPLTAMAQAATEVMFDELRTGIGPVRKLLFDPELVVRETTAPPAR